MSRRISEETREEVIRLYDGGKGLSQAEIARQTGVSYSSVYGLIGVRQRINPETGQPFESRSQYREYTTRQRINRPENRRLSELIQRRLEELGRNQSWLAKEMGVTRQAVSSYVKEGLTPTNDLLQRLYSSLDVPYQTLDDLLKDFKGE